MTKSNLGWGESLFQLTILRSHSITEQSQGRNLKAGTEGATEEHCILACSSWLASYPALIKSWPFAQGYHLPPSWEGPTYINNWYSSTRELYYYLFFFLSDEEWGCESLIHT